MRKFRLIVLLTMALTGISLACSTPVSRYAIDRMEIAPNRLMAFTGGTLAAVLEPILKPQTDSVDERIGKMEKSEKHLFEGALGIFLIVALGALGFITWLLVQRKSHHDSA